MRIIVFRVHKINIGEGIVTKGAIGCIKRAFPDAEVFEISLYSDKIAGRLHQDNLMSNFQSLLGMSNFGTGKSVGKQPGNHARIVDLLDADLAIIPGGILRPGIDQFMDTFRTLRDNGIPILLLGAGGNGSDKYSNIRSQLLERLEEINVQAIITRDHLAYDALSDDVDYIYDGIDCGFYLKEWYTPPPATKEFSTISFDKSDIPDIDTDEKQIYPIHTPFNKPFWSLHRQAYDRFRSGYGGASIRKELLEKEQLFLSDNIREYLFLYANTNVTHSDRIHSCVPTLAYGGSARLYTEDLRRHIFDGLINGEILKEPVQLLSEKVKEEKQNQVDALTEAANFAMGTEKN